MVDLWLATHLVQGHDDVMSTVIAKTKFSMRRSKIRIEKTGKKLCCIVLAIVILMFRIRFDKPDVNKFINMYVFKKIQYCMHN